MNFIAYIFIKLVIIALAWILGVISCIGIVNVIHVALDNPLTFFQKVVVVVSVSQMGLLILVNIHKVRLMITNHLKITIPAVEYHDDDKEIK